MKKLPIRYVFIVGFFDESRRVLEALLAKRREAITRNFTRRRTVSDRPAHYVLPLKIDGEAMGVIGFNEGRKELRGRLRNVFLQQNACVQIVGQGGSGKTSLACWIGRMALRNEELADQDAPIFPGPTAPVMLEGQLGQPLLDAIHSQMNALMNEVLPREILLALLKKGMILVIADGLSEMSAADQVQFARLDPAMPHFPTVITSRRRLDLFGGVPATEITLGGLSGPALAGFFEF